MKGGGVVGTSAKSKQRGITIMPNRIIKESIRTSKTVNTMTDFQFRLWVYLITYVDDYGRGSADSELLKGFVFPRRKRVSEADIGKALAELAGMGCINLYEVDGESYFCFPNWGSHQRIQTKRSKFPEPQKSTVDHGGSRPESESESKLESESESKSESETRARVNASLSEEEATGMSPLLEKAINEWLAYKSGPPAKLIYTDIGREKLLSGVRNKVAVLNEQSVISQIDEAIAGGWKGMNLDKIQCAVKSAGRYDNLQKLYEEVSE